jgi:hypothetical protein
MSGEENLVSEISAFLLSETSLSRPLDRDYPFDMGSPISEHGPVSKLVVECDGHDFHERTKEQAKRDRSRDRAIQQMGITIFRFTGSEIYQTPLKCARQIFAWAEEAAWKKTGE